MSQPPPPSETTQNEILPQATVATSPRNGTPMTVAMTEYRDDVWVQHPVPTHIVVNARRSRNQRQKVVERQIRDVNFVNLILSLCYSVFTPYYLVSSIVSIYGFLAIFTYDRVHLRVFFILSCIQIHIRFLALMIHLVTVTINPFFVFIAVLSLLCDFLILGDIPVLVQPPENPNIRTLFGIGSPQTVTEIQEVTVTDPESPGTPESTETMGSNLSTSQDPPTPRETP